ncbi:MAG: hypothetical protein LBF93_13500, partial [Zoogloeaceae bacterium]|nr:hypothetical protein [Zoogloeaceae bacterium]
MQIYISEVEGQDAIQKLAFDPAGRIVKLTSGLRRPDGRIEIDTRKEFAWDRNGKLRQAMNEGFKLYWFYDAAGNLMAGQQHDQKAGRVSVWRHAYDPLGNRTATLRPDGHRVEHLTYGAGHVHGIVLDGEEITGFERDDLHREIERTFRNGLVHYRRFDPAGRLQEQILTSSPARGLENATPPANTLPHLFKRTYHYDKTGQLTRIQESGKGEINYRYDPVGRLTESLSPLGREKFAFDPAGNLLDVNPDIPREASGLALETEKHNAEKLPDNLVREHQGTRYRYDTRGNLVEKISPEGTTRLKWNSLNQLIEVDHG